MEALSLLPLLSVAPLAEHLQVLGFRFAALEMRLVVAEFIFDIGQLRVELVLLLTLGVLENAVSGTICTVGCRHPGRRKRLPCFFYGQQPKLREIVKVVW